MRCLLVLLFASIGLCQSAPPTIQFVVEVGDCPGLAPGSYGFAGGANFGASPTVNLGGIDLQTFPFSSTGVYFAVPGNTPLGPSPLIVRTQAGSSAPFSVTVSAIIPCLVLLAGNPPGYLLDPTSPDLIQSPGPGDRVRFFANGLGATIPAAAPVVQIDGQSVPVITVSTGFVILGGQTTALPITAVLIQIPQIKGGPHFLTIQAAGQTSQKAPFGVIANGLILSQTGLFFSAVQGGSAPPRQGFSVLSGIGAINFTVSASTLNGGTGWLQVSPPNGTSIVGLPGTPIFVSVNPTGLTAGAYYGLIQISSNDATNSPQVLAVVLNVSPPNTNNGATLDSAGLVFVGAPGGNDPPAQTVNISNTTSTPLSFTSALTATTPTNQFRISPSSGTIAPGQSAQLNVQATLAAAAAINTARIALSFSDQSKRTVNLLLVVAAGAVTPRGTIEAMADPRAAGCTPTKLLPVLTLLGDSFNVAAAWPTPIEALIVDDCGTPMTAGSVVASFSNGDPTLKLVSQRNGKWSTTWPPMNTRSSGITVTVNAIQPENNNIRGTASVSGGVQANPKVPSVNQGGVVDAASYAKQPAPGTLITIFGSKLSDGNLVADSLPLKTQLLTTSALLAGEQLPLVYTTDGQVAAMVPYDIATNAQQQLLIQRAGNLSVPQGVPIGVARPGVFTIDASGMGQGHIYKIDAAGNQILAGPATPAQAGDFLVIYCGGLGAVDPPVAAGVPAPLTLLTNTVNAVTATLGGQDVKVQFGGLTPGFTGLYQVNLQVPSGLPDNNATTLTLTVAGETSAPVTFAVKNSQ